MSEANSITARLLMEIPKRHECLIWRHNTGAGIGWGTVKAALGCLKRRDIAGANRILAAARPVQWGLVGSPDIVGMIGPHGVFVGLEVKDESTGDEQSMKQVAFEMRARSLGGIYIVVRSVEQGLADLAAVVG